jgi:hypothetical protein
MAAEGMGVDDLPTWWCIGKREKVKNKTLAVCDGTCL